MKSRKSWKQLMPITVLASAVLGGGVTYARPAYSCNFFTNPFGCFIEDPPVTPLPSSWNFNAAAGVANWFKDVGRGIGQFAARDVWGKLITSFSCPFTTGPAFGTTLACFPRSSMQTDRILAALDFMTADKRADFTYAVVSGSSATERTFQPSSFSIGRIAYILDGFSKEANLYTFGGADEGMDAVTTIVATGMSAPVVVWPSAYTNYPTSPGLAGTLVHEADHTRFGGHTCASWADTYEDGPYGTEIQYLAKISRSGHPVYPVPDLDRGGAWDKAAAKLSQICNGEAQNRLWNKYLIDKPNTSNPVVAAAVGTWQQAASPAVTEVAALADGRVFGVGTDGAVYETSAGSGWMQATTPQVRKIALDAVGNIYAVGMDGAVYHSPGFLRGWVNGVYSDKIPSGWTRVVDQLVTDIAYANGYIYGLSLDHAVYRAYPGGQWSLVAPPWVQDIAVTPDGNIYGVGGDNAVYRTTANQGYWDFVAPPSVSTISVTPSGYIYGVGDNRDVFVTRAGASWQSVASPSVSTISVTPDGVVYGVGDDNALYVHTSSR